MQIYNSLSKKKHSLDLNSTIKMYVCGPTVYDKIHLGNARTSVVYDSLYRFLQKEAKDIIYVRNITDIDDKIIESAKKNNTSVGNIVDSNIEIYHKNLKFLNCLEPTYEPKVSENLAEIQSMIKILISKGFAYPDKDNNIYFNTSLYSGYHQLSNRNPENSIDNSRNLKTRDKQSPHDFALWKNNSKEDEYGFHSPWGFGRPGWHIECSAMANKYLDHINIHGGGIDLLFPHHTNERAQSCCALDKKVYADIWMHTGMLEVNQSKMSKSLNNFITINELEEKNINGNIVRLLLLSSHYSKPLNYSSKKLEDMTKLYNSFSLFHNNFLRNTNTPIMKSKTIRNILLGNFNTTILIAKINEYIKEKNPSDNIKSEVKYAFYVLGITFPYNNKEIEKQLPYNDKNKIQELISKRKQAKLSRNFELADTIKHEIQDKFNVKLYDLKDGNTMYKLK